MVLTPTLAAPLDPLPELLAVALHHAAADGVAAAREAPVVHALAVARDVGQRALDHLDGVPHGALAQARQHFQDLGDVTRASRRAQPLETPTESGGCPRRAPLAPLRPGARRRGRSPG